MNSLLSAFDGIGPIVWRMSWHTAILSLLIFGVLVGIGRRVPPRWQFLMWALVFVRLVTPSLPETPWSLFNWLSPSIAEQRKVERSVAEDGALVKPTVDDAGRFAGPREVPMKTSPFNSESAGRVADLMSTRSAESAPIPITPIATEGAGSMFDLSRARWKIAGALWLLGAVSFGSWLVTQFLRLRRQAGSWLEANDRSLCAGFERCRSRFGISRRVRLYVAPGDVGPAVWGVFRPAIVVPEKLLAELSPVQWEYVFLHEMAHIARHDVALQWLAMVVRSIHWFNPAAWWAEAKLKAAREESCDAMVLDIIGGDHRSAYCDLLYRMVSQFVQTRACPALLGMPTTSRRLARRIEMIHDYRRPTWLTSAAAIGLFAAVAALGLTDGIRNSIAQEKHAQATTQPPATSRKESAGAVEAANAPPAAATSRAWYILRQPNTHDLFHGLPQRVDKFLTSPRTGPPWKGVPDGGSLKIRIYTEGDAVGEIIVAVFSDPRWWLSPPVQLRSFPGPGEYIIDKLPLGNVHLGAVVGGLPRPKAYGVHQTWPVPVEVNTRETAETRVLVSSSFQWMSDVRNTRDFTGDWPKMNPARLITVRAIDGQENPVPFCRVTLVRRDAQNTFDFIQLGTDDRGNAYSDAVEGTFSISAQRNDFVPETLAARWQSKKIEQLHDAAEHPTITVQWEPFPTGTATLTGRVSNQRGEPVKEFDLDISSYKGERRDWSDSSGFGMRIPVIDAEGRFDVKGLAAGKYEITAHAFDYYTHVYEWNAKREFVIPAQQNATVEFDVQLEAREMRYGRAVYLDGSPAFPGGWSATFQANDSMSWNTNADGTFRVGLSVRERELLNKNSDGLVEVYGSGTRRVTRTVRAEHLSLDPANPYKVVLPWRKPPPETNPTENLAALPAATSLPDDAKAVEALNRIAAYVKLRPNGTASEISFLQTNVADEDLVHLKGTPSLTKLDLQSSGITDAGLAHLRGLAQLETLNLRGTRITDAGLENLRDLTRLQSLDIACRGITDSGIRHLERLTNLKDLHVESTRITDAGLAPLQGLTRLEELVLPSTITDEGLKSLARMTELRSLGLTGCRLTEAGVIGLSRFSKLENLSLGGVPITDAGIERLTALSELKDLNLLSSAVTDEGLELLKSLPNLRSLAISPAITDDGLAVLGEFPKLEALTIPCPNITDAGMVHLAELKQLTNIRLYNTQVTDEGAARLAVLKKLIALDLRRTQVTAKGLDLLRTSLPRMQYLEGP